MENKRILTKKEFRDITMKYLDKKILSRIWLSFGTLFLEFGKLDEETERGEVNMMLFPAWRFQKDFEILDSSDKRKEDLEKSLPQYVGKRLNYSYIDDNLHELYLDFKEFIFATFRTGGADGDWNGWVIFFNDHLVDTEDLEIK